MKAQPGDTKPPMPGEVLQDEGFPLPGGTALWRYMRLSAFFALLDGYAFFPAVRHLHGGDPMEGEPVCDAPEIIAEFRKGNNNALNRWLTEKAKGWEKQRLEAENCQSRLLVSIWVRELAKRRAVWCWHDAHHESAAMWSVYAQAGVAVMSTVAAIRQALPSAPEFKMARVRYVSRRHSRRRSSPEIKGNARRVLRPFLWKREEFEHEKEVRVFTRCSPEATGIPVFDVKFADLIRAVRLSPLIHHAEAKSLRNIIEKRLPAVRVDRSEILGNRLEEEKVHHDIDEYVARKDPASLPEDEESVPPLVSDL